MILLVLIIGLAIRFVFMPITSSPFDIAAGWVAVTDGIYAGDTIYSSGWYFYPPIWGQLLSVTGVIGDFFGAGSFGDVFPSIYLHERLTIGYGFLTELGYNFFIKVPAVIFDVLAAWAGYALVKRLTGDQKKAVIGFALMFLAPVVIMSSAMLNMFDSIMIFLMLLSLLTFMDERYFLTGIILSLAVFTKVFALLIIPLMLMYVLSNREITLNERAKRIIYALGGFLLITLLVYLPTILSGEFMDSLWFLTSRGSSYGGFSTNPDFSNIFFFLPIIAVMYISAIIIMLLRKTEREKTFLWLVVLCLTMMFIFPFVSYTPTYGIVMLPAILIMYSLKGNIAIIPWILLIFFPLHGLLHYWECMFYPLAAFTGFVDMESVVERFPSGGIYYTVQMLMSSAGMVMMAIMTHYLIKKKEVVEWISTLRKSQ